MNVHVRVERDQKENNMGLLRRFRQRVLGWGGLRKARAERYASRPQSTFVRKKNRLRALKRKEERERLYKLGLIDKA